VRDHTHLHLVQGGESGAPGVSVLEHVEEGSGQDRDIVEAHLVDTACSLKIDFATPIHVPCSGPLPIGRRGPPTNGISGSPPPPGHTGSGGNSAIATYVGIYQD